MCGSPWRRTERGCAILFVAPSVLRRTIRACSRSAGSWRGMTAICELAEERFATALQKDPSNSILRHMYAMFKLDQSYPDEALALNRRSLEIDPMNPLIYVTMWASYMDLWDAEQAIAAAAHYRELAPSSDPPATTLTAHHAVAALGRLAGSISDISGAVARLSRRTRAHLTWLPLLYYFIGDLQTADALMEPARRTSQDQVQR